MASLLFDDDAGLVTFLAQTSTGITAKSLGDARKEGLDLIVEVVELLGNSSARHSFS